ncbi:MAG: hypothetical protein K9K76_07600 [Halanaerobiales bacterium]|nr:hypothetical protein [Halanaerobiales bacterium]
MNNNNWEEKKKEVMKNKIPSFFEENKVKNEENESDKEEKLERKDEESFEDYIKRLQTEYKYDPRPDLKEDSQLWQKVLKTAEKIDKKAYYILHGFRCGGAKLKTENGEITMISRTGRKHLWQSKKEYMKDRKKWLIPLRKSISEIFNSVE